MLALALLPLQLLVPGAVEPCIHFIVMRSSSAWLHNRNHLFAIRAMQVRDLVNQFKLFFCGKFIWVYFVCCYTCTYVCMHVLILFDVITTEIDWFHSLIAFGKLSLRVRGTVVVSLISLSNTSVRYSLSPKSSFPCQQLFSLARCSFSRLLNYDVISAYIIRFVFFFVLLEVLDITTLAHILITAWKL